MDEPTLSFEGVKLSPQKELVRVFYKEMWDRADKTLIPRIFHPDFSFRGSLGPTLVGHDQFAGYVDMVTGALARYTTDILALIEERDRVGGKMRFHGIHRAELFGVPPSGPMSGGSACRSSPSRAARCAICTYWATFTG